METKNNKLFLGGISAEKLIKEYGSPLYVYEEETIRERYSGMVENIRHKNLRIYYACKANANIEILKLLRRLGAGIETVSVGEVAAALKAGFKPSQMMFTCDNVPDDELRFLIRKKIAVNIDSLSQLEKYGELNPGSSVGLRINQGIGGGEHSHIITGGPESKFGIHHTQIDDARKIAAKHDISVVGLHQHIGSGVLDASLFIKAMNVLLSTAHVFQKLEYLNFGGGFGVAYRPEEKPLDLKQLGRKISDEFERFCRAYGSEPLMIFEPGKYIVSESGVLLATVIDIKKNPERTFVGVDSGFNHLIRPAFYGSYHRIVNASSVSGRRVTATLAGNICESGDVFSKDREMTACKEGDVIALLNAGAYGYSMSSNYNLRLKPAEVLVGKNKARVIRKRERIENIL